MKRFACVSRSFHFDAAHRLSVFGDDHKCARLHGHTWKVTICVDGEISDKGIVIDYYDIASAMKPILEQLDHNYLNEIKGLSIPTSENICAWIWDRLSIPVSEIILQEGVHDECRFSGPSKKYIAVGVGA
jgi:6-pyruvoyltetrahydropterin/6-carboxytetrahydropterin synthase